VAKGRKTMPSTETTTLDGEPALAWTAKCSDGYDVNKLAALHGQRGYMSLLPSATASDDARIGPSSKEPPVLPRHELTAVLYRRWSSGWTLPIATVVTAHQGSLIAMRAPPKAPRTGWLGAE
jgi:hypothetical protein